MGDQVGKQRSAGMAAAQVWRASSTAAAAMQLGSHCSALYSGSASSVMYAARYSCSSLQHGMTND